MNDAPSKLTWASDSGTCKIVLCFTDQRNDRSTLAPNGPTLASIKLFVWKAVRLAEKCATSGEKAVKHRREWKFQISLRFVELSPGSAGT